MLAAAVDRDPSAVAVRCDGVELTYRELDERSSQLARVLIAKGVGAEVRVAIALPRSIRSVLAVWAVAKTGAAFVPVDPTYPAARIAYLLSDSGVTLGLTRRDEIESLPGIASWLVLDDPAFAAEVAAQSTEPVSYADRAYPVRVQNAAYVIYSSGSTGTPKGVTVTHAGLAGFCAEQRDRYSVSAQSRTLHFASPSFDASVLELLLAIGAGATMVIAPTTVYGGAELTAFLRSERVTHAFVTPAALASADPNDLPDLEVVVAGGEDCPQDLAGKWAGPTRQFFNGYGPTEATIMTNISDPLADGDDVVIGAAIRGMSAYILDSRFAQVPTGVTGELYLAGPGLARGYHDRAGLTASRFIADPFGPPGSLAYRTGDLARRRSTPDGSTIKFMGRNDFQLSINGFRIEPGEVDAALTQVPDVMFAVTVGHTTRAGATVLASYVVPRPTCVLDPASVMATAAVQLPKHLRPAAVTVLTEIPLTPTGKLDRSALPAPVFEARGYEAPQTPTEKVVADVFEQVLDLAQVGRNDDFFDLGGNSLLATKFATRLGIALAISVPTRAVFEQSTVAGLAAFADADNDEDRLPQLATRPRPARVPLSFAQSRYWFLNQFDTNSAVDNIPVALRLSDGLDVDALRTAIADVVARHETLRTVYPTDQDGPHQVVLPASAVDLPVETVTEADVAAKVLEVALQGFDITVETPVHMRLFRTPTDYVLAFSVHHISADGSSTVPFARDLALAYAGRTAGVAPVWAPLAVQYTDYTLWQHEMLGLDTDAQSLSARQIAYWKGQLAGLPEQLDLPTDRSRPAAQSFRGATVPLVLDDQAHAGLLEIGRANGATLFMVMQSALAVLLARLSGTSDIAIGTPLAGRSDPALDDVIGMFVNTLVFRTEVDGNESFADLLTRVKETDLEGFANADVPFERLVEELNPARSAGRNPLFQIGFAFQNFESAALEIPGLTVTPLDFDAQLAKTDLQVSVHDRKNADGTPGTVGIEFGYATDLFDADTVTAFAARYRLILDAILTAPSRTVGDIELLDSIEQADLLALSAGEEHGIESSTLVDLFDAQVAARPDSIAVVSTESLTYAQFDARVNRVARHLISVGVGPETIVALPMHRSVDQMIAMYAIVKSGGTYLPIDPDQPAERTAHIVDAAQPVLTLSTLDGIDTKSFSDAPVTNADRRAPLHSDNAAYVIFTSGSTGRPKGVTVSHRAIVNQLAWKAAEFGLGADDSVLLKTAATFDLSVWEYWSALTSGGRVIVASADGHRDPAYLTALLRHEAVTTLHVVPSILDALLTANDDVLPATLRRVLTIGEALPTSLADRFRRANSADLFNVYGPTEAAVSVTAGLVTSDVSIGLPEWNTQVHVLDERLRPVPTGVPGELYIAGPQLARGYLDRPDLTADRFVANPFGAPGTTLYRTGDLASWRQGALHYLGRTDFQVKVRGYRIELGEIEAVLDALESVARAVVIARTGKLGDRLVAYVVPETGRTLDTESLQDAARTALPSYMVPTAFVVLDALPQTVNGKLDRNALPDPVFEARKYRAPRTTTEQAVATVFADLLGAGTVGLDDDFFDLGGNSLIATQAVARVGAALDAVVPVRAIFEASTVGGLAALVVRGVGTGSRAPLVPQERPDRIPLSLAQQRMWFLNRFDSASAVDNVPAAIRLRGRLDVPVLQAAVNDVVARHEILRTVYPAVDGAGVQVILPADQAQVNLSVSEVAESAAFSRVAESVSAGFDVTTAVPVRAELLRLADDDFVLVVVVHHISTDGFSMGPLTRDVMLAYAARAAGEAPEWAPLSVQYADYTLWQRDVLGSEADPESVISRQVSYWTDTLTGLPDQIDLPSDRPRPTVASNAGATHGFTVSAELQAAIGTLARSRNVTPFMVVHAALALVLARLSNTNDIVIGTPIAGRGEQALDDLVGMFVNTLVLRTEVDASKSFDDLVATARETDLQAFANADLPFERLVDVLNPARSQGRHPLFQVAVFFQNMRQAGLRLGDLNIEALEADAHLAKFDLQFAFVDRFDADGVPAGYDCILTYATDLFDESTVAIMSRRFVLALETAVAQPDRAVGDIALLAPGETDRILRECNDTEHVIADRLLLDGFVAQAAATPDATALVFEGETLTYGEFANRVNRLARKLIADGVGPGSLVALKMPRSLDLVVCMYAVLTAGGGYVPVDPDHPAERIQYILDVAVPVAVLSDLNVLDLAERSGAPVTDADRIAPLHPEDVAYVIFTSGSTGRPKGVAVSHRAIVNQMAWMQAEYQLTADDIYLQKTAATFDVSTWGFFMPLRVGATLVLATPDGHRDPAYLADRIRDLGVTVTDFVPAMLAVFAGSVTRQDLTSLRSVFVIGEALSAATVRAFSAVSDARVHNLYGPTEAAVSITYADVTDTPAGGAVSIGVPQWNSQVYVLDGRLQPVPVGVPGELYLGGAQLARGYHGRVDLTSDRFVANPHGDVGARMYRTGDLVSWNTAGELVYIGRTDFQVKFRGQRIELGEIETALQAHPSVLGSAVSVAASAAGDQLVGYVVPTPGTTIDLDDVKAFIGDRLPSYMLPGSFMALDEFPLNSSGKLDRKALPAIVFETREFRAPSTPIEEIVADTFADVLRIERVGLDDDFFALGGNSLVATQVAARLGAAIDARVPVRALFEAPTVHALAARLETRSGAGGRVELTARPRPEIVPLSVAQQRMWFLNRFDTRSAAYNIPAVIRLSGDLDIAAMQAAINDVIARHEVLRTVYPEHEGTGRQDILSAGDGAVAVIPEQVTEDQVLDRATALVTAGFDVTQSVPLRIALLEVSATEHVLVLVAHHISSDGLSMGPLARDIMLAYAARSQDASPVWAPLPVQYADYTLWQHEALGDEQLPDSAAAQQISYWENQLADLPDQLNLPTDRPRPAVQTFAGGTVDLQIDADLHRRLAAIAAAHGASIFMVAHTALAILLGRMSDSNDVPVGAPIAGRGEQDLDDLIGMFVNTLVLRTQFASSDSFSETLTRQREIDLRAYANADLPFERIVELLAPERSTARNPLFQVAMTFQNIAQSAFELPNLTVSRLDIDTQTSQFDLHMILGDTYAGDGAPAGIGGHLTYTSDLFDESTVRALAERFVRLLEGVAADPNQAVGDIDLLDNVERDHILTDLNATAYEVGAVPNMLTRFEQQVVATPDAIAVISDGESVTYAEFAARVNRLTRWLIAEGVGPESAVAVGMRRSVDHMATMYAVLTSGAVYVPLDPDHPADRVQLVLDSVQPSIVLTASYERFTVTAATATDTLDLAGFSSAPIGDVDRRSPLHPSNTAYVLYTSGSTGTPKGVAVTHESIVNHLEWMSAEYGFDASDVYLQRTSVTFDVSLWGYFLPLYVGGHVVLAAPDGQRDPEYLGALITAHSITKADFVPSMLGSFLPQWTRAGLATLRDVFVIGEALPPQTIREFAELSDARVHNIYGPTEVAISMTAHTVTELGTDATSIPIGVPAWNCRTVVLDSRLRPVPLGVTGELYLAGIQLARGYYGRSDLTADRFVADPYGEPGDRMYRTGDVVRWNADGELVYIGRTDHQVKIRGFRIEPADVDSALTTHPAVRFSLTVCLPTPAGEPALVSYVHAEGEPGLEAADMIRYAAERLPSYLVPKAIQMLDTVPLTTSGKVDRKQLPAPDFSVGALYQAPRSPLEMLMAEVFADVLHVDRVGIDDDFFDLGGTSLLAFKLRNELSERLSVDIPTATLFRTPTVRGLSEHDLHREPVGHTADELAADAQLGTEFAGDSLGPVRGAAPSDVLLTGATGFVGAHLLSELLNRTDAQVWCLARAADELAAYNRIHRTMETYRLWDDTTAHRIVPIVGDLGAPSLGLSDKDFEHLSSTIDVIYHNGARVNHIEPYARLRAANVEGTREIIRLATTDRPKPIHYVSTASASAGTTPVTGIIREHSELTPAEVSPSGYIASKWVAEQLILQAGERGLPTAVYRPGLVSGDTEVGVMGTDDSFWNMIRAAAIMGFAPEVGDAAVPLVPVSYVARAIVDISKRSARPGAPVEYNLVNRSTVAVTDVFAALRRRGLTIETGQADDLHERLADEARIRNERGDDSLVRATLLAGNYAEGIPGGAGWDDTNTRKALADSNVRCPRVDADALDAYVDAYIASGFFPAPEWTGAADRSA